MAEINEVIRVFISSKESEFAAERAAMARIVSALPLLAPVIAEDWAPSREEVKSKYLGDVRASPIYVGLFGCLYSAATELEYRAALENPYREILVYVRSCSSPEPQLKAIFDTWFVDCEHTVKRFTTWEELLPVFEKHLWSAVRRMIQAYLQLASPEPVTRGEDSVFQDRWQEARSQILSLGLPGPPAKEDAHEWAERLSIAYAGRFADKGN
jgi:Domain of unknown function (DUF4062)